MNATSIQSTINELAALGEKNKKLQKELKRYLGNIQKRADEEKESINAILSILTGNSQSTPKKVKKTKEKRIKLTDEEILVKVQEVLSCGKKLSQSTILSQIGIQYSRFKKFLQNHPVLGNEGKNKTSLWFLKA
jgi:Glu-tRNA(Gln) amidotransferase subunit E-like FAD-binding protein